jgi:hypothetical protein
MYMSCMSYMYMSYVYDTRYKINHMKRKTRYTLRKKTHSVYVNKVKSPDLVLVNKNREYR